MTDDNRKFGSLEEIFGIDFSDFKPVELPETAMSWQSDSELESLNHVEGLRWVIAHFKGVPPPMQNQQIMNFMTHHFGKATERFGKYKAMRAELLRSHLESGDMAIGKAEGLAKGSEFGQKAIYYEQLAASYQEMINTAKKNQDFHENVAKNKY